VVFISLVIYVAQVIMFMIIFKVTYLKYIILKGL